MKNLIVISTLLMGLFGIVKAEETTTVTTTTVESITTESDSGVTISGELSTDFTTNVNCWCSCSSFFSSNYSE